MIVKVTEDILIKSYEEKKYTARKYLNGKTYSEVRQSSEYYIKRIFDIKNNRPIQPRIILTKCNHIAKYTLTYFKWTPVRSR